MGAWGGHKNGAIPSSAMGSVEGHYFEATAAKAMAAALAEIRAKGIKIHINEGYRPLGVPGDAKVKDEHKTASGKSSQWFQYGRMQRGETPAAAYPGGSIHGWGKAADVSPGRDNATVNAIFNKHGFHFDIPSESWHCSFGGGTGATLSPDAAKWKKIQTLLVAYGYNGAIDGIPGPKTWTAAQKWLKAKFGYAGAIDGIPGPMTYGALAKALPTIK
jgi:hypothetical protein